MSRLSTSAFAERILPAPLHGGFRMDDYWIWCGSVVRSDEDHRFHMFASRWPKCLPMSPHWLFNSEIVRASSDTPEGPYQFEEVVLPRRGPEWFDGMSTHNPSIRFFDGTYYLFYLGVTYAGSPPTHTGVSQERWLSTWNNKRIGLAASESVFGPWTRRPTPLLMPRPGHWDCTATTNPSAAIMPDGTTYMVYKSRARAGATLQLGITRASHPLGPYKRIVDSPILQFEDPNWHVEDPFLWYDARSRRFNVIVKDDYKSTPPFAEGFGITGEWGAGVHAVSDDCIDWKVQGKCYSRDVKLTDGSTHRFANLERPNLLFEGDVPTHIFCAAGEGPRPWSLNHTRNICLPLSPA